jgi:hypothetical protein
MFIKEESSDAYLKKISRLYARLDQLFADVSHAFLRWSLKQEGILLETGGSEEEARLALQEIDRVLAQLKAVDKKFKFDNRILESRYRAELKSCQNSIGRMIISVNGIWKHGNPAKRNVPFGDTTNYRFITSHLVTYADYANARSTSINDKTVVFNNANEDLSPLPVLQMITIPAWARNL